MRKIVFAAVIAGAALSLSACSKPADEAASAASDAAAADTLNRIDTKAPRRMGLERGIGVILSCGCGRQLRPA